MEILSPPPGFSPAKSGNNDSLALRITYGANSFLLTGDLESPMERLLLADRRAMHADVLKVGHHGSKTSTACYGIRNLPPMSLIGLSPPA